MAGAGPAEKDDGGQPRGELLGEKDGAVQTHSRGPWHQVDITRLKVYMCGVNILFLVQKNEIIKYVIRHSIYNKFLLSSVSAQIKYVLVPVRPNNNQ